MTISVQESKFSIWKLFIVLFLIAVLALSAGFAIVLSDSDGVDIPESVTVDIPEGAGASVVAQMFYDSGIIKYPTVFRLYSKLGGYDGNYKPGIITIDNGMSYNDILHTLIVSDRNTVNVVIPEGYTIKQIASLLSSEGLCGTDEFISALDPALYDYEFLKNPPERSAKLEGYLFPATYEIIPGQSAQDIVKLMLDAFSEAIKPEYYAKAQQMNMTLDQIITMASIIERETNADTERAKVAGVFYNRIKNDQKLESCATVQYILGENKPVLSVADTKIDSPYNTYLHKGLPIGPISSPGEECIKAALYPEQTDAFYFVLGSNGEHIFSKTYEEHQKSMRENGL